MQCFLLVSLGEFGNDLHKVRDVDKIFNRLELSVLRQVWKSPLLKIFMTVEGFLATKIEFSMLVQNKISR